jgi:ferredoxin--NADP+ reductase
MSSYTVAIVGAGPAGYFAAQALQNLQSDDLSFSIDIIERLPTPWGLVRSGVAPDHPKIKTVAKVFEKVATAGNVRLLANVELGKDLSIEDLKARYDAVVIATGTSQGRTLGIPGEDLPGSMSAATFVPWYNAHPDFKDESVDLSTSTAVVIGAGNVAMDVARMLALEPSELDLQSNSRLLKSYLDCPLLLLLSHRKYVEASLPLQQSSLAHYRSLKQVPVL